MSSKRAPLLTAPAELRFEHFEITLGVENPAPRLSWFVPSAPPDWAQEAYEIELRGERFRISSAEQVLVAWPGAPLAPREAVRARVRVYGAGLWSDWSEPAVVEAGLLGDWRARFIGAASSILGAELDVGGPVV